jgi:hypothetical protein
MNKPTLPELPPDHEWDGPFRTAAPFIIKKRLANGTFRNMAYVNNDNQVKVWKVLRQYVTMGECDDLQQALNMAAALVALGEADE